MTNQAQLKSLLEGVNRLGEHVTLLNLLHTRTDLENVYACELEDALSSIDTLLSNQIEHLQNQLNAMLKQGGNHD